MEFSFKAEVVLNLAQNKGEKKSQHISTEFNLDVSNNLNRRVYLNNDNLPTQEGAKVLTECLIQGLAANIHHAHQQGYRDSAEHLRHIIAELERVFVTPAKAEESYFSFPQKDKPTAHSAQFSDFIKEQLEVRNMTEFDFSRSLGLQLWEIELLLRDKLPLDDTLFSKLDKLFGMSDGYYKRICELCQESKA